jgi:hypothetical protein
LKRVAREVDPYKIAKTLALLSLPLVLAIWRAIHEKDLCLSPRPSLQSGTKREAPEGTSGFTFLVTSFLDEKEVT